MSTDAKALADAYAQAALAAGFGHVIGDKDAKETSAAEMRAARSALFAELDRLACLASPPTDPQEQDKGEPAQIQRRGLGALPKGAVCPSATDWFCQYPICDCQSKLAPKGKDKAKGDLADASLTRSSTPSTQAEP